MGRDKNVRELVLPFVISVLALSLNGCATIHVYQAGGPGGRHQGNQPATEWESKRTNTFLWGAIRQDVIIENCVLGDGSRLHIEEIKIEKKFGFILANVLTLGIWEPSKISWRCAKPKQISHD